MLFRSTTLLDQYEDAEYYWQHNTDEKGGWIADWDYMGPILADLSNDSVGKYVTDVTNADRAKMATMPAQPGYTKGQYRAELEAKQASRQQGATQTTMTSLTTGTATEGGVLGDLAALTEGVSDQAIQSWYNLDAALKQVLDTLNGGGEGGAGATATAGAEGGSGLLAVVTTISDLFGTGIPTGIETMCTWLEGTLPSAIETALQSLGNFNDEGEATGGNTLYTALGSIKGVFEDINAAIKTLIDYLENQLPAVVQNFKKTSGTLEGLLEGIRTAAAGAADEFRRLADNIQAAIDAYDSFGSAGVTAPGGGGSGNTPVHAHGGLLRGVGLVGEQGPEIISTSRNMNVFTNRALQIAQNKIAGQLARTAYVGTDSGSTSISNNNSRNASISIGTVLGADWVKSEVNQQIERIIRREMFYAS